MAKIEERITGTRGSVRARTRFYVRYRDPSGRQRSKSFHTKGEAEALVATLTLNPAAGGSPRAKIHLVDWYEQTRGKGLLGPLKPKSMAIDASAWTKHVEPKFGGYKLADITRAEIQRWIDGLAKTYSYHTVKNYGACLRRLLALAVRDDRLSTNPYDNVQITKKEVRAERPFLTQDQVVALEAAIADPYKIVVAFLADTGLRIGELAALAWGDIDTDNGIVHVRRGYTEIGGMGTTKTGHARDVPTLTAEVGLRLVALRGDAGDDVLAFAGDRGAQLRPGAFRQRYWKPAVVKAGLEELNPTPHSMRHTAISRWIEANLYDDTRLASWAGHSVKELQTTYAHVFPHDAAPMREALAEKRLEAETAAKKKRRLVAVK